MSGEGSFLAGIVVGALSVSFLVFIVGGETWMQRDAREACQAAGFHGGDFNVKRGYICFNYLSEKLP